MGKIILVLSIKGIWTCSRRVWLAPSLSNDITSRPKHMHTALLCSDGAHEGAYQLSARLFPSCKSLDKFAKHERLWRLPPRRHSAGRAGLSAYRDKSTVDLRKVRSTGAAVLAV